MTATVASDHTRPGRPPGPIDGVGRLDKQTGKLVGGEAVTDDLDLHLSAHLGKLLKLPLVEYEVITAENAFHEDFERGVFPEKD